MTAWIEEYFGADWGPIAMWFAIAFASLVLLLLIYWIVRRMFSGTFIAGGRARKPRLAILDAAAVDSRRRLVLIRRDDVEHLILIGGPTDVVIEQGIRHQEQVAQREKTAQPAAGVRPVDTPRVAHLPKAETARLTETDSESTASIIERPREKPAVPAEQPPAAIAAPPRESRVARPAVAATAAAVPLPGERALNAAETPARRTDRFASAGGYSASAASQAPQPARASPDADTPSGTSARDTASSSEKGDLDSALLRELEATLDRPKDASTRSASIEDDMAKMIAEMERERV